MGRRANIWNTIAIEKREYSKPKSWESISIETKPVVPTHRRVEPKHHVYVKPKKKESGAADWFWGTKPSQMHVKKHGSTRTYRAKQKLKAVGSSASFWGKIGLSKAKSGASKVHSEAKKRYETYQKKKKQQDKKRAYARAYYRKHKKKGRKK